ncbi:MAG: tRNA-dihydrouridine synthase [Prolixibacteraceae bacterium]|jgi:tRNA-dihydrouridine synthase|nr:tRNA-dihydrouridine synthase [Prolixibacteraceae bacterium]
MNNFWKETTKPIFALAPMEDVTDTVFREIVMRVADPSKLNVVYTEFTNVNGMNHPLGKLRVGERLIVNDSEVGYLKKLNVKLVAQVWGKDPEIFHKIVKEISDDNKFDGIDINMGCPVKNVVKNGCCSALIGSPELAKEIILASKEATQLPVSVKTRIGLSKPITEEWIGTLMETNPAAIILHGRVQKQQSDGLANWDEIALGAEVRNRMNPEVAFLGNGDVISYADGVEKTVKYKLDGVMIGRGIFHNPWFFAEDESNRSSNERIDLLLQHVKLYNETWGPSKNFNILKRFFKIYTSNFIGASQLRNDLMQTNSLKEVKKVVEQFQSSQN